MNGWYKKLAVRAWREIKKRESIIKNDEQPNLIEISNALDEFYFLEKLKLNCYYLSYYGMVNKEHGGKIKIRLTDSIIEELNKDNFNNPAIRIYLEIRNLFLNIKNENDLTNDTELTKVENLIKKFKTQFTPSEIGEVYSYLSNYAIKKLNQGHHSYKVKIVKLYVKMLNIRYGILKNKKLKLNVNIYTNIVKLAIWTNEENPFQNLFTYGLEPESKQKGFQSMKEWTMKFIEFYRYKLPSNDQDKFYRYSKGLLLFHTGDYISAYSVINSPKQIRGLYINLDAKILNLKILYELQDAGQGRLFLNNNNLDLMKIMESYRDILKRDKYQNSKLSYQRVFFETFLNLFRNLYTFYLNYKNVYIHGDKKYIQRKKKLRMNIESIQFSYRLWFIEKLDSI